MLPEGENNFYISKDGSGRWSGSLPAPSEDRKDGPWPSLDAARLKIREGIRDGRFNGPVHVWIREGVYNMDAPVTFTPEDSYPVTYASYPGETAVLDGGREITGWAEETVNGVRMWTVTLPEAAAGRWYFRQLFVNGERRERTRYPETGESRITGIPGQELGRIGLMDGTDRFFVRDGDIRADWKNLNDCMVVAFHYWVEERFPIQSYDPATGLLISPRKSIFGLNDDVAAQFAAYYAENVFEALGTPGRWYLDRSDGKLYYVPLEGERLGEATFQAPVAKQLIRIEGNPADGKFVGYITFKDLIFRNCDWEQPARGNEDFEADDFIDYAASPQAAVHVPGVINMIGAHSCAVEDCEIRNAGFYAVALYGGCVGNHIVRNHFHDIGAGGVKIHAQDVAKDSPLRSGCNTVSDNHMHALGRVFFSGVGIIANNTYGNTLSHNEIHDLYYTGISCGWAWSYDNTIACDNRIEKNRIYGLGHGLLSDMGGIYTLGVQPGTVIRGNLIHDVVMRNYGGWAIYPDQGSSHMIIENNICYDVSAQPFHQNLGRENIVRNNIFAFGGAGAAAISTVEPHVSLTYDRNIFVTEGQPMYCGRLQGYVERVKYFDNNNLYWDYDSEIFSADQKYKAEGGYEIRQKYSIDEVKAMGKYNTAVFADPKFRDAAARDLTLADDSPAFAFGFKPIDMSDVGPRENKYMEIRRK